MCYSQRPDVRIQQVDDEILLLDDQNGYIHQLNETARFVWCQCDGNSTPDEIARRLVEEFDVEEGVALRDVKEIVEKLLGLQLLKE